MLCNIPLFLLLILILLVLHVVQKFKETLKSMLNMESPKKCMNILLLIDAVFQFWQNGLLEWERCNILARFGEVPSCLHKLINKFAFNCLANGNSIEEVGEGAPLENDNFKGVSSQRREAEAKVHV